MGADPHLPLPAPALRQGPAAGARCSSLEAGPGPKRVGRAPPPEGTQAAFWGVLHPGEVLEISGFCFVLAISLQAELVPALSSCRAAEKAGGWCFNGAKIKLGLSNGPLISPTCLIKCNKPQLVLRQELAPL